MKKVLFITILLSIIALKVGDWMGPRYLVALKSTGGGILAIEVLFCAYLGRILFTLICCAGMIITWAMNLKDTDDGSN